MDLATYFNQDEMYFSESQGQLIRIDSMVHSYALNCFKKLLREFGDEFTGTHLFNRFYRIACPRHFENILAQHGVASYWLGAPKARTLNQVRSSAYRAGKKLGMKVKTRTGKDRDVLIIEVVQPETRISVRGKALAHA